MLSHLDHGRVRRITLVAPAALRPYLPDAYDDFVDTDPLGLTGCFTTASALCRDARIIGSLLRECAPDVVLGMMHYPSALVTLGARLSKVRTHVIASYRGPFYEYLRRYEQGFRRRLLLRTVVAGTAWLADRVIVPSGGTAAELRRRFLTPSARIVTILNGIDHAAVARAIAAPTPELADLDGMETPVLCAMARLAPEKNLGLLLTAFRQVCAIRPARLIILGDGPEREALEAQIADWGLTTAVYLLGYHDNVYPYLRRADLFIHTCEFEGFGYAMLEALACGTAVIATDCPYGPREILGDSEYGVLIRPNDPQALADAILSLLCDPERRQALAKHGLERAEQLSIQRMVTAYQAVFTGLVHC